MWLAAWRLCYDEDEWGGLASVARIMGIVKGKDVQANQAIEALPLKRADRDAAAAVLGLSFEADPLWTSLVPDPEERVRMFPLLWEGVISYCMVYGRVETTAEVRGVACWARPGMAHPTMWRMLRSGGGLMRSVMVLSPSSRKRFNKAMSWLDAEHRRLMPSPHWYLWALGVDPESQGQGIGTALLQPVLKESAKESTPCYLETQTQRNVQFYRRLGFEVLLETEVPGLDLRIWCMARS